LGAKNEYMRGNVVEAVKALGSAAATPGILVRLEELIRDTDEYLRGVAADALDQMNSGGRGFWAWDLAVCKGAWSPS